MDNLLKKLNRFNNEFNESVIKINEVLEIEESTFLTMFESDYAENAGHASLINSKNCTELWKVIFDDWKQQGILN